MGLTFNMLILCSANTPLVVFLVTSVNLKRMILLLIVGWPLLKRHRGDAINKI